MTGIDLIKARAFGAGGGSGGSGGGSELLDALIDRSITEVKSDASSVGIYAFQACENLTTANFPVATSIKNYAFRDCTNLTALILRNATLCTLSTANGFRNTPIESGTGYIYVPSALVDTYKAATNWSTFAAQFRALEDYTVDGTTTGALDPEKIGA